MASGSLHSDRDSSEPRCSRRERGRPQGDSGCPNFKRCWTQTVSFHRNEQRVGQCSWRPAQPMTSRAGCSVPRTIGTRWWGGATKFDGRVGMSSAFASKQVRPATSASGRGVVCERYDTSRSTGPGARVARRPAADCRRWAAKAKGSHGLALPPPTDAGELPLGVHPAHLSEVLERFARGSAQRRAVALRLARISDRHGRRSLGPLPCLRLFRDRQARARGRGRVPPHGGRV